MMNTLLVTMPYSGSKEELVPILSDTARHLFGFYIGFKNNIHALSLGSRFSLNPNTVRLSVTIQQQNESLQIRIKYLSLPWTKQKMERIARFRLIQITDVINSLLKKEEPVSEMIAPFSSINNRNIVAGITTFAAWSSLSAMCAFLLGSLFTICSGVILMDHVISELSLKSELVIQLGGIPLPSLTEIAHMSALEPAILFTIPIITLTSISIIFCIMISENFRLFSWLIFFSIILFIAWFLMAFMPLMPFIPACILSLAIPLSIYTGYTFAWGRKGEIRNDRTNRPKRYAFRVSVVLILFVIGIALVGRILTLQSGHEQSINFTSFRDRLLLSTNVGKTLTSAYYQYTMYPAYLIKPLFQRTPLTMLSTVDTPQVRQWAQSHHILVSYHPDLPQQIPSGFDLLLIPNTSNTTPLSPISRFKNRIMTHDTQTSIDNLNNQFIRCSINTHDSKDLSDMSWLGWRTTFLFLPIVIGLLLLTGIAVLILLISRRFPPLRRTAVASTLLFLVGCSVLLSFIPSEKEQTIARIRALPGGTQNDILTLLSFLHDPDADIRFESAFRMYNRSDVSRAFTDPLQRKYVVQQLIAALEDDDPRVLMWLMLKLRIIQDPDALDPILKQLSHPHIIVRCKAAEALAAFPSPQVVDRLAHAVKEDSWYVALYAMDSLHAIQTQTKGK